MKNNLNFLFSRQEGAEVVVGGVVAKGNKDFPPVAASVAHQKPLPTHENRAASKGGSRGGDVHLSQPKKFNNWEMKITH